MRPQKFRSQTASGLKRVFEANTSFVLATRSPGKNFIFPKGAISSSHSSKTELFNRIGQLQTDAAHNGAFRLPQKPPLNFSGEVGTQLVAPTFERTLNCFPKRTVEANITVNTWLYGGGPIFSKICCNPDVLVGRTPEAPD